MNRKIAISIALLLSVLTAFREEDNFISQLQGKLTAFYDKRIPVKLHVSLNQPRYVPGDTMLYKITFVNAAGHSLVPGRQVIHIHLVDLSNVKRIDVSVLVKDGVGAGALTLPKALAPGSYMLQAYHDAMLIGEVIQIFQQPVIISGEFLINRSVHPLEFFPESGRLIDGATSRVVVHGPPLSQTSIIQDDHVIATVNCDSLGWGDFYLAPDVKSSYFFESEPGTRMPLPLRVGEGVSMMATGIANGPTLRVAVQSTEKIRYSSPHYLVLSTEDQVLSGATIDLAKKRSHVVSFPKDSLRTGVYALTLFTSEGEVVSERLLFIQGKDQSISVSTSKKDYHVREEVTVKFKVPKGTTVASMAVSVFQEDLFGTKGRGHSLQSYFNINGVLPDAVGAEVPGDLLNIDRFMISQSRRNFSWKEVWSGKQMIEFEFEPYQRLRGRAIFKATGLPVPDSTQLQFFFQNELASYQAYANSDGKFAFPLLFDFYGEDEVHFIAESQGQRLKGIQIVPADVRFNVDLKQFTSTKMRDRYSEFFASRTMINGAFYHAKPPVPKDQVWLNQEIEDEVDGADVSVRLSDYLRFPTMHETLLEIIPAVKSRENRNLVRVQLPDQEYEAKEDPIYIIDGVITDNTAYFLALNPADVETIKVINRNYKLAMIGGMARNGVVLVDTKIPDHRARIPLREQVFSVFGLIPSGQIPCKTSLHGGDREPDLQSTLYWNPDVSVKNGEATITFYAADNTGTFRLVADGVARDGSVLSADCTFTVSFQQP
jgi:hypothetical protein